MGLGGKGRKGGQKRKKGGRGGEGRVASRLLGMDAPVRVSVKPEK